MDFSRMKRSELQALCAEHGLGARGSKADLAASLAGAISAAAAAAAEKVVEVMVGKGCLKRSGNGPNAGSSGAVFKRVTFSLTDKEEEDGEALVVAKVSRRGCQQKCIETVSSAEGFAGEVCVDARVMLSRKNMVNLRAGSGIERRDNLAEEEREIRGASVDKKQRVNENPKCIADNTQAGVTHRSTRKLILSTADTSIQNQNDAAEKEGEVIRGAGLAEAEEDRKVVCSSVDCKQKQNILQYANNVAVNAHAGFSRRSTRKSISSTAVETSIQSQNDPVEKEWEVIGGVGHTMLKRNITGKLKVGDTPAAIIGRGCHHMCTEERGSNSSVEGVTGQVGADAQETLSKSNAGNSYADSGVESHNIPAEAEGDGTMVRKAVYSKQKQKTLQNAENIVVNAGAGISQRSTTSSSLLADNVLLYPAVEKKRGRKTTELGIDKKSAEVQDLLTAASCVIIESKKRQRTKAYCKLAVQKSARLHVVIENKSKMKTEVVHLGREVPAVSNSKSDVPRNNAPITRSLRNIDVQNNNTMLEETHVAKKLEKERQPRGSAVGRHQQFTSSVEEEEQAAAPCESPPLLENARGEETKSGQYEDVGKRPPVRRSTCNRVVVSQT
ncbi:hypothetical protein QOZ80_5BG0429700 [Eleusine coracana subsp. coracana]|nr:hypothetical protein QOZ80_5BG0429700 [Eleusine coracana subsp. coracana]